MSAHLITQFTLFLENSNKSRSTVIAYAKDLSQLSEYIGKDLDQVTSTELREVVDTIKDSERFTAKTISRKINSYRTFYKYLLAEGLIKENPTVEVKHPKLTPKPPRVLTSMEYLALREVSRDNDRLYAMIELMLQTGIRIGELSRLKVKDVSLKKSKGTLHIVAYSTTGARTIELNAKALQLLRSYMNKINTNDPEAPLFATRDGKHIIIRNIRSSVDRAMAKAGIKDACVNDLRNTFIVAQLEAGIAVDLVAEMVGHRSRTTTHKYLELLTNPYQPSGETKPIDL